MNIKHIAVLSVVVVVVLAVVYRVTFLRSLIVGA